MSGNSRTVYVGVLLLELEMPWVRSLKEKRSLIKPLTERIKLRFPVSVARLDGLDAHAWERIGVSVIGHDAAWIEDVLNKVRRFAEGGEFRIRRSSLEVEVWDAFDDYPP